MADNPSSITPQASPALADLRVQIDSLDHQLLTLLNQRARVAEQVGELKKREGTPFFRPDRVAQVIEKITRANPGPLKGAHVAAIWREIMSACLALESPQRVAVLGPEGTFCEQAAIEYFGGAADLMYCANFDEVFHATAAGSAQYGVVGVENSNEGVVTRSLDMFLHTPCHVVGEVSLLVRHNLLRQIPSAGGIEAVLAHPQALAQCQAWLSKHLPHAERRPVSSNAEGARRARNADDAAAIGGESAGHVYGLKKVVTKPIQNDADNTTRFLVVGRNIFPTSGHDRTSVLVFIHDKPGALFDVLSPFARHGISMNRIESRPSHHGKWEYGFFIDLAGHIDDAPMQAALAELEAHSAQIKVLGSYPVAVP